MMQKIQLLLAAATILTSPERSGISAFAPSALPSKSRVQTQTSIHSVRRRSLYANHKSSALHMNKSPNSPELKERNTKENDKKLQPNADNPLAHAAVTAALAISILTTLMPLPAIAGFGPTGGATTTQTPMQAIQENTVESLSPAKLKQLVDSNMRGAGLSSLANQVNKLVDALTLEEEQQQEQEMMQVPKVGDPSQYMSPSDFQVQERERLDNARKLQQQIIKRTGMLEKLEAQPAWFNYFAAFVGSVVSTSIMHPVDTIKTRLMMTGGGDDIDFDEMVNWNTTTLANMTDLTANYAAYDEEEEARMADEALEAEREVSTAVLTDTASETRHYNDHQRHHQYTEKAHSSNNNKEMEHSQVEEWKDSVLNLYDGLLGNILKEGPPSALYLGVYELVKLKLQFMSGITNTATGAVGPLLLTYLVAGAAGETVGSTIRAPAESLKSLVQTGVEPSVTSAAKRVFGTPEGRANTFKAWSASVCRDVPFGAIQLAIFELVKIYILNSSTIQWDAGTLQAEAIIGAFAGGIGSLVTTPADVITTRIITQDPSDGEGFGIVGMAKKIYEEEGSQAFIAGWEQRVLYWAPAISIFLTCYCSVRQMGIANEWFG